MKKFFLMSIMFWAVLLHPAGMPSVAQVFGGMTEDEITAQVKMGQQFLEDLERYGTPEDKAQFEQLLLETLNSMTAEDFNDIQNIAKMVEPHLDLPPLPDEFAPEPTAPINNTPEVLVTPKVEASDVQTFQKMINTIVSRIDEMLQKFSSSKATSEEIDTVWSSKTTLNSMKRQIYQLATQRLAQKLTAKSLSEDDKSLVSLLEQFLKDLTQANDSLKIEDDFGLPSSAQTDAKHLRQARAVTSMLDSYIDSLMPKLEKFLRQWDPEALQLAQEAQARSVSALDSAKKAQIKAPLTYTPSLSQQQSSPNYSNQYDRGAAGYGYDMSPYEEEYYNAVGAPQGSAAPTLSNAQGGGGSSSPKAKESAVQQAFDKNKQQNSVGAYQDVVDAMEDHLTTFGPAHQQKFIDFLNKDLLDLHVVDDYGMPAASKDGQQAVSQFTANNWVNGNYAIYRNHILDQLRNNFSKEFKAASAILEDANKTVRDMSADELKKAERIPGINRLKDRYTAYKQAYEEIKPKLQALYDNNWRNLGDVDAQKTYQNENLNFMNHLKLEIEERVEEILNELEHLQRKIRRQSTRKSSSSSNAVNAAVA